MFNKKYLYVFDQFLSTAEREIDII